VPIDPTNTRRFRVLSTGAVVAVYDQNRTGGYILYADVGTIDGVVCFVSDPVSYWADEIEEL
jgi:hypothetical protein